MNKLAQEKRLLAELKKRALTKMQMIHDLGILNGGGRIHDLRNEYWNIKKRFINVTNRDGSTSSVAQYYLGRPHRLKPVEEAA